MNSPKPKLETINEPPWKWKVGDLVLHKGDAKTPQNLLIITSISELPGQDCARYAFPDKGLQDSYTVSRRRAAVWCTDATSLVDPAEFGIKVEDWQPQ